ncbi:MAG TPA: DUF929 family protein [Candidatus Dormibacteraeota bacterium]|nr:DUF929 family protein [Candidatus Dormibacteraeota bacterium]
MSRRPPPPTKTKPKATRRPMRKPVRRTPAWVAPVATIGALALVVVAFLAIRYMTTPSTSVTPPDTSVTAAVLSTLTGLPSSELDQVGTGAAQNIIKPVNGPALTVSGKPMVFYFGAEYCPYCAAERWAMIVALSRFGTFSGLQTTTSSSSDIYPDTPTFTFHGASYTSQYIVFQSVESSDRNQHALESPTASQVALVNSYDSGGSIPFVDFGNRYAFDGATYKPDVLQGLTSQQVANDLQNPSSPQAQGILGSANLITAAICKLTSNQPTTACTPAIQAIEAKL